MRHTSNKENVKSGAVAPLFDTPDLERLFR